MYLLETTKFVQSGDLRPILTSNKFLGTSLKIKPNYKSGSNSGAGYLPTIPNKQKFLRSVTLILGYKIFFISSQTASGHLTPVAWVSTDCWHSGEFIRAPIPGNGSSKLITITNTKINKQNPINGNKIKKNSFFNKAIKKYPGCYKR